MRKLLAAVFGLTLTFAASAGWAQQLQQGFNNGSGSAGGGPIPTNCAVLGGVVTGYLTPGGPLICGPGSAGTVVGPGATTVGNVPQWGDTAGLTLTTGLPAVTSAAASSLPETGVGGTLDLSFLPAIPNASLQHSSLTIDSKSFSLGGSGTLDCTDLPSASTGCSTTVGTMATQNASGVAITAGAVAVTADPVNPLDVATKEYVDNLSAGIFWQAPVEAATTTALPAVTYANGSSGVGATLTANADGVLVIDGYTPLLNDRLLIQNQAAPAQNGVYTITTLGTVSVEFVLTRATDNDSSATIKQGNASLAIQGTVNMNKGFVQVTGGTITPGTTSIVYAQFTSTSAACGAGQGISVTGGCTVALASIAGGNVLASGNSAGVPSPFPYGLTGNNVLLETSSGGLISPNVIPTPAASALGGVQSLASTASNFLTGIGTNGIFTRAQPAFTDISGRALLAQLPQLSANNILGSLNGSTNVNVPLPSCSGTGAALQWTPATGFSCGSGGGGGGGVSSVGLGAGLTTTQGTQNTGLQAITTTGTIFPQLFPVAKTVSYALATADYNGTLLGANGSGSITFTLLNPGTAGRTTAFSDVSGHGYTITTTGGSANITGNFTGGSATSQVLPAGSSVNCVDNTTTYGCVVIYSDFARLGVQQQFTKPQDVILSTPAISTATFTPDMTAGQDFKIVLVHASCPCTIANPTLPTAYPQHGEIEIDQSSTGSDTIGTWGSSWIAPGGVATLTLSSGVSARDFFAYTAIDSTHIFIATEGLAASH